jgi:CubicO group peptidase (beta-lactamase class C family)
MTFKCTLAAVWLVCSALAAVAAPGQTSGQQWDWETASPESQGMSGPKLEAMSKDLAAHATSGLLVVRNDKIVWEWYASGWDAKKPHGTASMAKAIVGGVSTAVALTDGRLSLDDKAAKYIPQWRDDPRKSTITVRQLGSHTSGIEDAEVDEMPHDQLTGWKGDFWKQKEPPHDPFTNARDVAPVLFEPGTKTEYSNPGIAMLSYAVTAALTNAPQKDLRTLLRERVMRPIGVPEAEWSVGYTKTYMVDGLPLVAPWGGGSYTARAVARVARLMLRKGDWEGKQLLSPDAVRLVTTDAGSVSTCAIGWWSNNQGVVAGVPKDAFWGSGAGHQCVFVVPSLNLIAVRNGQALSPGGSRKALYKWLFEPLMGAIADRK